MVLAGGEGRRLQPLTASRCKPAVSFAGSLRVIDFTLFNCALSGLPSVHVLTQYRTETLHSYLSWRWRAPFRAAGGQLRLLPSSALKPPALYRGTADAVYRNRSLLRELRSEHVLVLSGDHVYRADYRNLLAAHRASRADVTLLSGEVAMEEASAFGVLRTDRGGRVAQFVEKPADPTPYAHGGKCVINLGVYVFRTDFLLDLLAEDAEKETSHDFGRDVLPASLVRGTVITCPMRSVAPDAVPYWRDVGTIESLFDAHMDLLDESAGFRLEDPRWPAGSSFREWLPHWYPLRSNGGSPPMSLVAATARIEGAEIRRSVIGSGAYVGRGAFLEDCVVFPGAQVGEGVELRRAIVDEGTCVARGVVSENDVPPLGTRPARSRLRVVA